MCHKANPTLLYRAIYSNRLTSRLGQGFVTQVVWIGAQRKAMPDASRAETSCHSSPFLLARSRSGLCGLVLSSWDTTHLYSSLEVLRASAEQVHFQVLGRAARHASLSLSPVTNCCTSHLKANPCHSASGKPRRDFWGFGVSTSCPADESYQEKITLFLEFCNLN